MRIAIFGTGYVGLVSGACFAEMGHEVTCVDIDQKKIEMLKNGHIPIYEPHLEEMVKRNQKADRLSFTIDPKEAIQTASVIFVAVPTQSSKTGDADLTHVFAVTDTLSEHLRKNTLVVIKSTVPVGTTHQVKDLLNEKIQAQKKSFTVDVAFNPEFLKEGCAVLDFMKPDRIILGAEKEESIELLRSVYRAFTLSHDRMIVMKVNSAEMTKYAANVMLASRISLMNEFANLCEKVGASIHDVRIGIGSDTRIGYQFLYAGAGYGGSCFPKDIKALKALCAHNHCESDILDAIETVNARQKMVLFHKLENHFKDLKGKVIT
jgi:UDPglucose 6-dehydrogenase